MVDNRFPSPGVDARFPSPGVDVRFPAPGQDLEHLPDGTDTRFQGATYGGAAGSPPVISVAPAVTGDAVRGSTLSCTTGTWAQSPGGGALSYAYQWTRDGANIGGATSSTYAATGSDVGTAVGCKVTATDVYGASSPATATGAVTVLSFSGAVAAMLSGTTGIAIDPTDPSTMWLESTKITPVSASSDPAGAIRTKWGNTQYDIIQATAGNRPAWDGTRFLVPDGTDFLAQDAVTMALVQNAPAYYIAIRIGGTHNSNSFFCMSTPTAGTRRNLLTLNAAGSISFLSRRLDADAESNKVSVSTTVTAGSTIAIMQDLAADGIADVYKDNVFVESFTAITGTPANGENTASARLVLLANMSKAFPATGSFGRCVVLPREPTSDERATIEAWLTEV